MRGHIVLGLQYGDEGKGVTIDYLTRTLEDPIVVRFSAGPQAGHTVMDGYKKHVHSNVGSGTFKNDTPTYFSEHTCIYLVTLMRELEILNLQGIYPKLIFHPLAKIITPYDRAQDIHSSDYYMTCGMGVGKTMKRHNDTTKFYAVDLLHDDMFLHKLDSVRKYYKYSNFADKADDEELVLFKEAFYKMHKFDGCYWDIDNYDVLKEYDNIVFEGSQGILLDKDHGIFPYVTYANTTSKNALKICDELGIDSEIYYVTRTYSTRHGEGPFEQNAVNLKNTAHEINVYNKYQGDFKIGPLDYKLLNYALEIDKAYSKDKLHNIVVTCMDQIVKKKKFEYYRLNTVFKGKYESYSPDSKDFKILR